MPVISLVSLIERICYWCGLEACEKISILFCQKQCWLFKLPFSLIKNEQKKLLIVLSSRLQTYITKGLKLANDFDQLSFKAFLKKMKRAFGEFDTLQIHFQRKQQVNHLQFSDCFKKQRKVSSTSLKVIRNKFLNLCLRY